MPNIPWFDIECPECHAIVQGHNGYLKYHARINGCENRDYVDAPIPQRHKPKRLQGIKYMEKRKPKL